MHEPDPLDRWEEEQQATTNPTLRDYAALVRAEPWIGFVFAFFAVATVFAAGQAATAFPSLFDFGFWTIGTLAVLAVLLVGLDEFDCRANENHTCRSCRQFEEKYREGQS